MALIRLLGTKPSGTLTLAGNAAATETVTIGARVYTFVDTLTGAANEVLVGATASDSCDNLIAAVNGAAGAGTLYGTGTKSHTWVTAAAGAGDTVDVVAHGDVWDVGTIATTETMGSGSWGATALATVGVTSSAAPTLTSATAGVAIPSIVTCNEALLLLRSTAGSGTMTATGTLWGYHPVTGRWYVIGAVNGGSAIAESATDSLNYAELVVGLKGFSRLHFEIGTLGGTNTAITVVLDCFRGGA